VGVITAVLLLPLAPARGFVWVAGVVADEAERQMEESASPSRALEELAAATANGEISPEEAEAREAEIIQRMLAAAQDPAEGG
jgi:cytochrome c-type biogenesis protein CcmH/NrfG